MVNFMYGVLVGWIAGYGIGLWASWYTLKEVKKHVGR
jgi:hypothetical protein